MKTETYIDAKTNDRTLSLYLSRGDCDDMGRAAIARAVDLVAEAIAADFMATRGQEVLAALDPVAIANLAVADAASAVKKAIDGGVRDLLGEFRRPRTVTMPGWLGPKQGVVR